MVIYTSVLNLSLQTQKNTLAEMEDDEDLEMLRLAALKSLKKENVPATKPVSNNKTDASHVIPIVSNRPVVDKYFAPNGPEMVPPNLIHHPVPPYVNAGFEKMDINDTYVPQRLNPPPLVAPFNEFFGVPPTGAIVEPITNVQLSPRSAAFVFENKQIIQRRQGKTEDRAHSPVPLRQSPGRWSRSPSRESWKYRRSKSRSPAYPNHSPHYRNRSISRSPQRRRHSPQPTHSRRNRSRSPIPRITNFEPIAHRPDRRSPVPNRRGNISPTNRHPPRWRGHSPQRENGVHATKSGSPRVDDANNRRRRTRSPNAIANANVKTEIRRRTSSRSPNRKNARINSNRPRRSPPSKRFNNANGNRPGHGGVRNRNHNRRSGSPILNHNRPHSPHNHHKRRSPARNTIGNGETSNKNAEKETNSDRIEKPMDMDSGNKMNEHEPNENTAKDDKTEQEMEDELLASSDSEKSDDDNNDEIDLFASEESESENEGRFKLSSSKSERKANVPTVSFSELSKLTTAPAEVLLRDLDEMQTDTLHANRRGGGARRENNRNRRDDRRFNRDRERENRDRNRDRERDRDREKVRNRGRDRESSKTQTESTNAKNDRKPTLFKSTVTSVDSETRTKTPDGGKMIENVNLKDRQLI